MSTNQKAAVTSPRRFALHHLTSLALLILGLGLFAFIGIADEVLEGDTMRLDRWIFQRLVAGQLDRTYIP